MGLIGVKRARMQWLAEGIGQVVESNQGDAAKVKHLQTEEKPGTARPGDADQARLDDLFAARSGLLDGMTAIRLCNEGLKLTEVVSILQSAIQELERYIADLDSRIRAQIAEDPGIARRDKILRSIPGMEPVIAALLCAEMPELGSLDRTMAAVLSGTVPSPEGGGAKTGGQHSGVRRAAVREAFYMAAVSAVMHNADMKEFYEKLISSGKTHKFALSAVMHKMIALTNVLLRKDQEWEPSTQAVRE